MIHVRDAVPADVADITRIVNALIGTTTITWRGEPHPLGEREQWFARQSAAGLPVLHVDEGAWGAGVGRRLMDELIARAAAAGIHVMIGAVDAANDGSVRFHERIGFVEQGRLREVGWMDDRWLDLVFMVRRIDG